MLPGSPDHLRDRWHRTLLEQLCEFDRATASAGERAAAEWLVAQLASEGAADARIEEQRSHQTFWWPIGLAAVGGVAAGARATRGRSLPAAALAAAAAWAAACERPPRRHRLRAVLPQSSACNVLATLGPADARRTVVLVAHHDAAHSGLLFSPAIPDAIARVAPWFFEVTDTSPPVMWPTVIGPGLAALGAATGRRGVALAGALLSAAAAAVLANIGASAVVPGANDNGTGVIALIALARALDARPTQSVRVMLVSTAEGGLCEGMRAFADRHFGELPKSDTFFLAIDTIGSPRLLVLRGEGMLGMRDYPERAVELIAELAGERGISLATNLRLRNATDGVYPLAAGYQCASLCSCTELKQPANYHWPTDVPENVEYDTLADAIQVIEALVRRLDARWLD
ncbi:MAG: M28 family peptidase [Solirubrobacteraceae bacterium]